MPTLRKGADHRRVRDRVGGNTLGYDGVGLVMGPGARVSNADNFRIDGADGCDG